MEPNLIHLTKNDYVVSQWSGGTTTQLAIAPSGAQYGDRTFLWRLSSATVDLEESDFTPLPDYDRLIAPLRGEMTLTHNGGAPITLRPYQVHAFDGGADTHSAGLLLRRGRRAPSGRGRTGARAWRRIDGGVPGGLRLYGRRTGKSPRISITFE